MWPGFMTIRFYFISLMAAACIWSILKDTSHTLAIKSCDRVAGGGTDTPHMIDCYLFISVSFSVVIRTNKPMIDNMTISMRTIRKYVNVLLCLIWRRDASNMNREVCSVFHMRQVNAAQSVVYGISNCTNVVQLRTNFIQRIHFHFLTGRSKTISEKRKEN